MKNNTLKQLKLCFDKSPEQAVKFLKSKGIKVTGNWQERVAAIRKHCFTVAKASSTDVLQMFLDELVKAIDEGTTAATFKKEIKIKLEEAGFSKNSEGKAWHLDTIYRTNLQSSYMAGRYAEQQEVIEEFPYMKFIAVQDDRTTDLCNALNGRVVRANDSFWDTSYPPLHYNCRSRVIAVDEDYLEKHKLRVSDGEKLGAKYKPAPGFDNNPLDAWQPDIKKYDKQLSNALNKELNNYEE